MLGNEVNQFNSHNLFWGTKNHVTISSKLARHSFTWWSWWCRCPQAQRSRARRRACPSLLWSSRSLIGIAGQAPKDNTHATQTCDTETRPRLPTPHSQTRATPTFFKAVRSFAKHTTFNGSLRLCKPLLTPKVILYCPHHGTNLLQFSSQQIQFCLYD